MCFEESFHQQCFPAVKGSTPPHFLPCFPCHFSNLVFEGTVVRHHHPKISHSFISAMSALSALSAQSALSALSAVLAYSSSSISNFSNSAVCNSAVLSHLPSFVSLFFFSILCEIQRFILQVFVLAISDNLEFLPIEFHVVFFTNCKHT